MLTAGYFPCLLPSIYIPDLVMIKYNGGEVNYITVTALNAANGKVVEESKICMHLLTLIAISWHIMQSTISSSYTLFKYGWSSNMALGPKEYNPEA